MPITTLPAEHIGCLLDYSSGGTGLDVAIIEFALVQDMILSDHDQSVFLDATSRWWDFYEDADDVTVLRDVANNCVTWLNDHVAAEGMFFEVEDNSLFYNHTDEQQGYIMLGIDLINRDNMDDVTEAQRAEINRTLWGQMVPA